MLVLVLATVILVVRLVIAFEFLELLDKLLVIGSSTCARVYVCLRVATVDRGLYIALALFRLGGHLNVGTFKRCKLLLFLFLPIVVVILRLAFVEEAVSRVYVILIANKVPPVQLFQLLSRLPLPPTLITIVILVVVILHII